MRFYLLPVLLCALLPPPGATGARAAVTDDFHAVEQRLDDALLDLQAAPAGEGANVPAGDELSPALARLRAGLRDPAAATLLDASRPASPAARVGELRARLQHAAALEMLRAQASGQADAARAWRALITLPRFASGEENAALLQTVGPEKLRPPEFARALAREYVGWQTMRVRQTLDRLQENISTANPTSPASRRCSTAARRCRNSRPPTSVPWPGWTAPWAC